ncbi:MAG: L,D-transpeptidase [Pirellulales bacterium]
MQTIKTIVVVALLLTVCYGAYKAMNTEVEMPADLNEWAAKTGNDTLPDFSIPPITANDNIAQTPTIPSVSDNSVPTFPMPELGSNSLSQATPTTPFANNAAPLLDGNPLASSLVPSNGSSGLNPPVPDFPGAGATSGSNTGLGSNGPSVAFNPNSSAPDLPKLPGETPKLSNELPANNLLGDPAQSLIDAGSSGPSVPLLDVGSDSKSFVSTPSSDSRAAIAPTDSKFTPPTKPFVTARTEALQMATQSGKLQEALEVLSAYYDNAELGYEEHTDLVDILDALSREVVYSDRHLLLPPYKVSAQDNLQSLASKHKLNPEFLAAVNKMGSSTTVIPNTSLKVLDGPFRAQISLNKGELTLFLRKSYAGRFPVSISQKNRPAVGTYEVIDRRTDRAYYGANAPIPAGNPINPYGGFWIGLGGAGDYAIHGTPEQESSELKDAGCISLSPIDAADVYRILTKGSVVEIRQ